MYPNNTLIYPNTLGFLHSCTNLSPFNTHTNSLSFRAACSPKTCPFSEEYVHTDSDEMSSRVFGPPRGALPPTIIRQRQRKRTNTYPKHNSISRSRQKKDSGRKISFRKDSLPKFQLSVVRCPGCGQEHPLEKCPLMNDKKVNSESEGGGGRRGFS